MEHISTSAEKNREAYYKLFPDTADADTPTVDTGNPLFDRNREALKFAHRTREFEIKLYWQRSLYFWGFQVTFFTIFGLIFITRPAYPTEIKLFGELLLISAAGSWATGNGSNSSDFIIFTIATTCLPLFFAYISLLWTLMLDGAKAWQDNWERHVDMLEDRVVGPLYKTYFFQLRNVPLGGPGSKYIVPFSVTKINQHIAKMFTILWMVIALIMAVYCMWNGVSSKYISQTTGTLFGVVLLSAFISMPLTFSFLHGCCSKRFSMSNHGTPEVGQESRPPDSDLTTHVLMRRQALEGSSSSHD